MSLFGLGCWLVAVAVAVDLQQNKHDMVPRGLEPRTLRLLAVRSNQLSCVTFEKAFICVIVVLQMVGYVNISSSHKRIDRPGGASLAGF